MIELKGKFVHLDLGQVGTVGPKQPERASSKAYLGDGAYAESDGYAVILTTSNGLGDTNTIYLESDALLALLLFVRQHEPGVFGEAAEQRDFSK